MTEDQGFVHASYMRQARNLAQFYKDQGERNQMVADRKIRELEIEIQKLRAVQ